MNDKEVKGLKLDSEEWRSLVPDVMSGNRFWKNVTLPEESPSDLHDKLNKLIEEIKSRKLIK